MIGGTLYAGEIKKSIFTVMNYLMPKRGVMAMHCSANYGEDPDDVAIFFGLSGTGKTTLSNDTARIFIIEILLDLKKRRIRFTSSWQLTR